MRCPKSLTRTRLSLVEPLVVAICVLVLWQACKLTVCLCAVSAILLALLASLIASKCLRVAYFCALVTWILAFLLPFDIIVRQADHLGLRCTRVRWTHGLHRAVVSEAKREGLVEGRDYIVVDCDRIPIVPP